MNTVPKNYYNEDFTYIRNFTKISISDICETLGYNRPTIASGNGSDEQYKNVRKEIESRLAKLYLKDE